MAKVHAQILKKVKERMTAEGFEVRSRFICDNLAQVCWTNNLFDEGNEIKEWIDNQLNYHFCYEVWLKHNHYYVWFNMTEENFREARLQWLDWMIKNHKVFG